MTGFLLHAADLLRGRPWGAQAEAPGHTLLRLGAILVAFGVAYGAVMGTWGGLLGAHALQILISASKVPVLLLATFAITLPSFFVLNTLLGLRADFREALWSLMATQAGLTVILASLAPFTALWYLSSSDYNAAVLFNTIMFAAASVAAQRLLTRYYQPLIARNRRHLWMRRAWLFLYAFVGIQMSWILRPFIGSPDLAPTFFRREAWGNAYVVVIDMLWRAVAR